ncbi:coatomer subunit beta'-1-like isoform X1 [Rutidosis leptorrhynchoides]|uniref:coatomer subunit beta'-1-like isoform X1 n=1 Tax=Rutidosis leptorrhynchoides TaxID=125765 RepID=UPI003A99BD83
MRLHVHHLQILLYIFYEHCGLRTVLLRLTLQDSRINMLVMSVIGYTLLLTLIEYKTLVMPEGLKRASGVLPSIPKEHHNSIMDFVKEFSNITLICEFFDSVAHFLESGRMFEEALKVATNPDYSFELFQT